MEEKHNDLGWSEDESDDERVENKHEPTSEEKKKQMKSVLKKDFNQVLKNWRGLARGIKQIEEFLESNMNDDGSDSLDHLFKAGIGNFLYKTKRLYLSREKHKNFPKILTV